MPNGTINNEQRIRITNRKRKKSELRNFSRISRLEITRNEKEEEEKKSFCILHHNYKK